MHGKEAMQELENRDSSKLGKGNVFKKVRKPGATAPEVGSSPGCRLPQETSKGSIRPLMLTQLSHIGQ